MLSTVANFFSELMTEENAEVKKVIESMEGAKYETGITELLLKTYRPESWKDAPFKDDEKEKLGILFYMIMPLAVRSGNWSPQDFIDKGGSPDNMPYDVFVTQSDEAWALYLLHHHPPSTALEDGSEPGVGRGNGRKGKETRLSGKKLKQSIDWYSVTLENLVLEKEVYMGQHEMVMKRRKFISGVCKIWYDREKMTEAVRKRKTTASKKMEQASERKAIGRIFLQNVNFDGLQAEI